MAGKSTIDIFNVMSEDELTSELKNFEHTSREYQRLIAMNAIRMGLKYKDVAELVGVSYRTINRWAGSCSEGGLEKLMPNFKGGRTPRLTILQKLQFGNVLYLNEGLSMTEAQEILKDDFDAEYSLSQVMQIVSDLGFEYVKRRPEFLEAPENKKEILHERIEKANITKDDIIGEIDESTMKTGIETKKGIVLKESKKNEKK